jgi:hypothetical protein
MNASCGELVDTHMQAAESLPSAPLKAFDLLGASPDQGNVTALYPKVVIAFPRGKVKSNLRRSSSP